MLSEPQAMLEEANGHGSVMVRKEATQDEGKNSLGFLDDGAEVQALLSHLRGIQ